MGQPIWRIEIVKELPQETWANDYLTDATTIEDAQDLSAVIQSFERSIHMNTVLFSYIRISTVLKGDRYFRHLTTNLPGLANTVEYLPLYCTVRMDMPTTNHDPCRKYYRLPIGEGTQANGVFNSTSLDAWNSLIQSGLVTPGALDQIVTSHGFNVDGASMHPMVQMRQLHRHKRKKVVTP